MTSEKQAQKILTDDVTNQIWVVPLIGWSKFSANQKYYPDLGSNKSSVWNFCAYLSDVISRENQSWHFGMWAVFSGFIKSCSRNFIWMLSNGSLLTHILTLGLLKKDLHRKALFQFFSSIFCLLCWFWDASVHVLLCHTGNVYVLWILKCIHYKDTGSKHLRSGSVFFSLGKEF